MSFRAQEAQHFNPRLDAESKLLKGGYLGDSIGEYYRDSRSLDYGLSWTAFSVWVEGLGSRALGVGVWVVVRLLGPSTQTLRVQIPYS